MRNVVIVKMDVQHLVRFDQTGSGLFGLKEKGDAMIRGFSSIVIVVFSKYATYLFFC